MSARMRTRTALVAAVLLLTACSSKKSSSSSTSKSDDDDTPSRKKHASPSASASSAASPKATALKITGPDTPCPAFLVMDGHLYALDGDKLSQISDVGVQDAKLGPDGTIYIADYSGIHTYADGKLTPVGKDAHGSSIAFGPKGELWAGNYGSVAQLVGDKWVESKAPEDCSTCSHIGVDSKGTVYLAGVDKIASMTGDKWEMLDTPKLIGNDPQSIEGFANVGGTLYVVTSQQAISVEDGKTKLQLPAGDYGYLSMSTMPELTPTGELAGHTYSEWFISSAKAAPNEHGMNDLGLKASSVSAFAVDGQGRRWVGTNGGLAVLSKDDKVLLSFPPGSLPSSAEAIYVFGKGPELPTKAPDVVKGDVKGALLLNGDAVKSADVVLCDTPSSVMNGPTPCFGEPVIIEGKTDDQGVFHLKDVPRGRYGVAFKDAKGWSIALGGAPCCTNVAAGKEVDIGSIKIKD
jgi:hypothetical protein